MDAKDNHGGNSLPRTGCGGEDTEARPGPVPGAQRVSTWFKAAPALAFPENGGACVRYKDQQIAVFNFSRRQEWYACQNMCPHKMQMALSRGIIGSVDDEPKVACPFHKKNFSLKTGACLNSDETPIIIYPVKLEDGYVYIGVAD